MTHPRNVFPMTPEIAERYFAGETDDEPRAYWIGIGEPIDLYDSLRQAEEPTRREAWWLGAGVGVGLVWFVAFFLMGAFG